MTPRVGRCVYNSAVKQARMRWQDKACLPSRDLCGLTVKRISVVRSMRSMAPHTYGDRIARTPPSALRSGSTAPIRPAEFQTSGEV